MNKTCKTTTTSFCRSGPFWHRFEFGQRLERRNRSGVEKSRVEILARQRNKQRRRLLQIAHVIELGSVAHFVKLAVGFFANRRNDHTSACKTNSYVFVKTNRNNSSNKAT